MPLIILLPKDRKIEKSLKKFTNGLPQAFLRLNSKDMLSIFMYRLSSVFSATLQARNQNRASNEEEQRNIRNAF